MSHRTRQHPRRPRAGLLAAVALTLALTLAGGLAGCSDSSDHDPRSPAMLDIPNPQLSAQPITADSTPHLPSISIDLADYGYEQAEYFFEGSASAYTSAAPLTADGQWQVEPADTADFRTRLIVFRPTDAARFNGTLVVEWLNVSGGTDAAPLWTNLHTEMLRRGYAWAGVSAQRVGVEGGGLNLIGIDLSLKSANPARYGTLSHPGDSFSYDLFSQATQALRHPQGIDPLAGLVVERAIAAGESQSAVRLMSWINAFGTRTQLFDGFFIQSRLGSGAPLTQAPQAEVPAPFTLVVREDLEQPTIMVQTATDLLLPAPEIASGTAFESRQADSDRFRLWEVAGTAHADLYSFEGGADPGEDPYYASVVAKPFPYAFIMPCPGNVNSGPKHLVAKAALRALDDWMRGGVAPAQAARIEVGGTPPAILTDEHGNTLGGVRTPYVDLPIATFGHTGSGDGILCTLIGDLQLFDADKLALLYGNRAAYADAVATGADTAAAQGFLLEEEAVLVKAAAAQAAGFAE